MGNPESSSTPWRLVFNSSAKFHGTTLSDFWAKTYGNMEDRAPDVYVMTSVSFGDKPAAAIAALALKKTAELAKELC